MPEIVATILAIYTIVTVFLYIVLIVQGPDSLDHTGWKAVAEFFLLPPAAAAIMTSVLLGIVALWTALIWAVGVLIS